MNFQRVILCSTAFLFLSGCAAKRATKENVNSFRAESPSTKDIEPEARGLFFQADRAYTARNFDQAIRGFQVVRNRFPNGRAAELATYRIGSMAYQREDFYGAVREFEAFSRRHPQSPLLFDVTYNWAAAEYQVGRYDRSQQILAKLSPEALKQQGPRRAVTVYQLQGLVASQLGNHAGALAAYAEQMPLTEDDRARANLEENIDYHLERVTNPKDLQELSTRVSDPFTRSKLQQKLALFALPMSSSPTAKPTVEEPKVAMSSVPVNSSGEMYHVGVVLPLTGKQSAYGKKALEGIMLAARTFEGAGSGYRLFVEDSGSSPVLAARAVDKLVSEDSVSAIIGPLSYREALAVSDRAQELGVLNLSLTSKAGLSERNPYVFQNALTPRVQLEHLVQYAVGEKGFRRFAILAPNNAFGKDMTQEFWSLVEKQGGRVVAYDTYESDEKDFQDQVKSLVGLSDPRLRRLEWTRLQDYLKEQKTKSKRESKAKLESIVDFDAIFLPDSPRAVAAIAANLAYFDVTGIALLGTTEWNSDQLYRRGGRFVSTALFPGVMNPSTRSAAQRDFMRAFSAGFGVAPDLLAAQGFEAMLLVALAAQGAGSGNRNEMVKQLMSLREIDTPIGSTTFGEDRLARRTIPIYALDSAGNVIEQ